MYTITVPFYDDELYVVEYNNEPYVPMKPIVEGMGMDWAGQYTKLKKRFSKGIEEIPIPSKGGVQTMSCLALRKLAGWLTTIYPNKVKPEIRDKVIRYQDECDDVLYDYWTKGIAINPRKRSVMEELNEACAEFKRDKQIASVFGTGLNAWKHVSVEHKSKIRGLTEEIAGLALDFVLAEIGKGKTTRTK
ncbi:phage antirepressor N-terminal domain-containing protein [Xenorhabdus bovienii]|uniref:Ant protein n=1 Tax=Xenorhabdus bovienii str. Intermedium TaxID=1379677 RepID=A0A077QFS2_XENBV|nr:phage antirepressor N-terminal domain-containing protein [Xenorhabdus bovienii]CDH31978.1 Ant protein [Xenorhabdus bovienii str. Intermedium]